MKLLRNFLIFTICSSMGFVSYVFLKDVISDLPSERVPAAFKQMKLPNFLPRSEKKKKPTPELWACGCSNMSWKEQTRRGCSKGFAFDSMTTASEYARQRCGEECVPDCHRNVVEAKDEETESETL